MTLEIQILAWKIQKYGEVQLVNGKKIQIISKCLPTMFDCIFWFKIIGTLLLLYNKKKRRYQI